MDDLSVIERARRYLAAMPPAIEGSGGHNAAYAAACALVNGFALPEDQALELLASDYNPTCQPPWSDAELRHKLKSAATKPHDKPRGHLLGDDRAKAPRSAPVDPETNGLTLGKYAAAKRLPIDFLAGIGLSDDRCQGKPAIRISYGGSAYRHRVRLHKGPAGEERFRNPKGVALGAYTVTEIPTGSDVVLVEGESDVHTLAHNGFLAVGLPGAQTITEAMLAGYTGIMFVVDERDGGAKHLLTKLKSMACADRVRVLDLSPHKDPSDLWLAVNADREPFTVALRTAMANAVPLAGWKPTTTLPGVGILDLMKVDPENDPNALLGERRWFCRGNIGIMYGESGLGKSSLLAQLLIGWSIGLPVLGIEPVMPIRSLLVQAENDLGDLSEMMRGVTEGMDINEPKDLETINAGVRIMTEAGVSGAGNVLSYLKPLMESFRPDLLVIDPLFAFIGGNASDQEVASPFIRNMLMPLAAEYGCAILLVHHTNKPGQNGRPASFAGSQEWENAARMTMSLHSREGGGAVLEARKRGLRLGWMDAAGERTTRKVVRYSAEYITWVEDKTAAANEAGAEDREMVLLRYLAAHPGKHSLSKLAKVLGVVGKSVPERCVDGLRRRGWLPVGGYDPTPAGRAVVDATMGFESAVPEGSSVPTGGTVVPGTWDDAGTHGKNQASQRDGHCEKPLSVPASHHPKGGDMGRGAARQRRTVVL